MFETSTVCRQHLQAKPGHRPHGVQPRLDQTLDLDRRQRPRNLRQLLHTPINDLPTTVEDSHTPLLTHHKICT